MGVSFSFKNIETYLAILPISSCESCLRLIKASSNVIHNNRYTSFDIFVYFWFKSLKILNKWVVILVSSMLNTERGPLIMLYPVNIMSSLTSMKDTVFLVLQKSRKTTAETSKCSIKDFVSSILIKWTNLRIPSRASRRKMEFIFSTKILK